MGFYLLLVTVNCFVLFFALQPFRSTKGGMTHTRHVPGGLAAQRGLNAMLRCRPQRCRDLETLQGDWEAAVREWRQHREPDPEEGFVKREERLSASRQPQPSPCVKRDECCVPTNTPRGPLTARAPFKGNQQPLPSQVSHNLVHNAPASDLVDTAAPPSPCEPSAAREEFPPMISIDADDKSHKVPSLVYLSYRSCLQSCASREYAKALPMLSHIIESVGSTVQLGAVVFANRSVCHCALRNYHLCIKDCGEVLSRLNQGQEHLKCLAHLRRAYSFACLRQIGSARVDASVASDMGHPTAGPLLQAINALDEFEQLSANSGDRRVESSLRTKALACIQLACRHLRDPLLDAKMIECIAFDDEPRALELCAQRVLEFPDNAADLWFWFGKLQFACSADTHGLSDVQSVLHRAIGMGGLEGHPAAKKLLQSVRSTESRSAVAAAFTGTRRWEQALAEYGRLVTSTPLPGCLKAHFLIRRAWVVALGFGNLGISDLREALDNLTCAEAQLADCSKNPKQLPLLEEAARCKVELLLAASDVHGALFAAREAAKSFPGSEEVKKLLQRATSRSTARSSVPRAPAASPRNRPADGRPSADRTDGTNGGANSSSSEDDEFSSLNAFAWRARRKRSDGGSLPSGNFRPQSSTGRPSSAAPPTGGAHQRPSSARPAASRVAEHYLLLGVAPSTPSAGVVKAYRELALRWHPDRWSGSTADLKLRAEETFKKIQQAYSVLGDSTSRMNYDKSLGL